MDNVAGKITLTYGEKGRPEVEIVGKIRAKSIPNIPREVKIAYRQHVYAMNKRAQAEAKEAQAKREADETPEFSGKEPAPAPDATADITTIPTGPSSPELVVDEKKVEDLTNPEPQPTSEDKKDGTDEEAGRVRTDDEGQGRERRPWEKQD